MTQSKSAHALRLYLKQNGIKHKQFAERLGINAPSMSRIMQGHTTPSLRQATDIHRLTKGAVEIEGWFDPTKTPEYKAGYRDGYRDGVNGVAPQVEARAAIAAALGDVTQEGGNLDG